MDKYIYDENNGLWYELQGDYYIPCLTLSPESERPIGLDKNDLFRSTGKAYIQLAKEEPHILKIFISQERKNILSLIDIYETETNPQMAEAIAKGLDISVDCAKQLHLNMLIYTIGLGTIFSVSSPGIPIEEIFLQQEQAYQIFMNDTLRKRAQNNENSNHL